MGLTVISCNSEKKESIAYSGEDMSEVALITRNKETKAAILQISKDKNGLFLQVTQLKQLTYLHLSQRVIKRESFL